ncbi:hypothetical protein VF14_18340 [Nostoc linckia z18]|uniref:Lipoprotein n=2 Tax=Nostoc linckia TaxID=92942 RepID=A0A9Q5Z978_NOSLI|nr:hypothetical protein VF02_37225 [Nostoc linckia z1]PHJ81971.1 hypothetical protein VF07_29190 [Nostoc linckia z6]PHK00808.1 hypothetical protein VF08_23340 [Nostoc linckia z8]PHK09314.1 hypothetical protein VF09_15965 [Nostoc linckia z9]PHK33082.1 hypothetical protein VF14_18340 [Nostoc linckia z18]
MKHLILAAILITLSACADATPQRFLTSQEPQQYEKCIQHQYNNDAPEKAPQAPDHVLCLEYAVLAGSAAPQEADRILLALERERQYK